jgi:hypothetical protein
MDEQNTENQEQDFLPGELAPQEGPNYQQYGLSNERLPERLQAELRGLVQHFSQQEQLERRVEVRKARQGRYFWRGIQHIYWDADNNQFRVMANGSTTAVGNTSSDAASLPDPRRVTNIYQPYGRTIISVLTQNNPTVRFEPEDPTNTRDITAAREADKMRRIIERNNDMTRLQADLGRFLWTDGRVAMYTRYVTDGSRYGFEDQPYTNEAAEGIGTQHGLTPEQTSSVTDGQALLIDGIESVEKSRMARGAETISVLGVLEVKVPITANNIHDFPYLQYSIEIDGSTAKAAYPWVADKITEGGSNTGESEFDRMARISTVQGTASTGNVGQSMSHLVTCQRTWLRKSAFMNVHDEEVRAELMRLFPDGCHVVFMGDTYCESRNECMDDHWAIMHALPGDGQNRPALGEALIPMQETFNDLMNISLSTYEYALPATWVDQSAIDIDALQEQTSQPGAHIPAKRTAGSSMSDNFYTEPPASVSGDMIQFMENIQGPLAQFVTGALPSLFGGSMADNETAAGYSMARDQAMGGIGLIYREMKSLYARVMLQGVRCAAYNRVNDIKTQLPGRNGKPQPVSVEIEDLKGNLRCLPETDENFPESWSQKRNAFMTLFGQAATNPILMNILQQPDNQVLAQQMFGIEGLVIPGADSRNKQLVEIDQLLSEAPAPNEPAVHQAAVEKTLAQVAQHAGLQVPPPPQPTPEQLLVPSVPIDTIFDDHQIEFEECKRWINSPEGMDAKAMNPTGFQNVRLHALAHYNQMKQDAAEAAQQQNPPKGPSESINFKDLPPVGQQQLAQQAGIQLPPPQQNQMGQPPQNQ